MIAGADGFELPTRKLALLQPAQAAVADFPPLGPELTQVGACFRLGVIAAQDFEEAGDAKEQRFTSWRIGLSRRFNGRRWLSKTKGCWLLL
jgi:hypothetical protein